MHPNVLNKQQLELLPLLEKFKDKFGLVGGTAIALQIGHRKSVDFDLFTNQDLNQDQIRKKIKDYGAEIDQTLIETEDELSLIVEQVKFTFYKYPFPLDFVHSFRNYINLPSLKMLGAMKAFALGKRNVWRDYLDLYFIFQQIDPNAVITLAQEIYQNEFNLKLFKGQLVYFKDLSKNPLKFMPGHQVSDSQVKQQLEQISLSLS